MSKWAMYIDINNASFTNTNMKINKISMHMIKAKNSKKWFILLTFHLLKLY